MKQQVLFISPLQSALERALEQCAPDRLFVLTDTHTQAACWPLLSALPALRTAQQIVIPPSDTHKTLRTVETVWQQLQRGEATRHSCLICLGGGVVTDLGGFAASTFKRGMPFIHLPTTLLAMVDAAVGGKTGVNFGGMKNEVGVFSEAPWVIIDTQFLHTLDAVNLRSGYAEMLKHALIDSETHWQEVLRFDLDAPNMEILLGLLRTSVGVKERVVAQDPHEHGLRKALNLGHTVGHALESLSLQEHHRTESWPMAHGYAVAHGLLAELYLSVVKVGCPTEVLQQAARFVRSYYGRPAITCDDYTALLDWMRHDKKNTASTINFTFVEKPGRLKLNQTATDEEIKEALDFLREG